MASGIMMKSALNAAAGLSLLLVGFVCSIVVARLLGPEANGVIAFALWLALTGSLVAELGTGVTLLRLLPQLKGNGFTDGQRLGFSARLLRAVTVATLILLCAYALTMTWAEEAHWAPESGLSIVVITGLLFFIQSIGSFTKNYLIGEQRMATFFRITLVAGLLQLTAVVVGASLFGMEGALAGYILAHVVPFAFAFGILVHRAEPCGISNGYLVRSSFLLSMQFIVDSVFLNRLELFFLQQYHGLTLVGFYAAAASLANLALQLPVQLTGSLVPYYSEQLHQQGGKQLPASVLEGVLRSLSYVTLPTSFGLAAVAPRLVELVLGPSYAASGTILSTLALATPIYVFNVLLTQYMFSHDLVRERLVAGLVGAGIMIAGSMVLIPLLAGEGAALVRIIVFLGMSLLMLRQMKIGASASDLLLPLARVALAALLCAALAWVVLEQIGGVAGLLVAILAGAVGYFGALRLLRAVPLADRIVLERLAARLPGKARGLALLIIAQVAPNGPHRAADAEA